MGRAGGTLRQRNRAFGRRVGTSANAAAWRWPLHQVQRLDLSPSFHWADPTLAITPDPEDGPLLITVEYRVSDERASDFLEAMDE